MDMKVMLSKTTLNDTYKNISCSEGSSHFQIVEISTDFLNTLKPLTETGEEETARAVMPH